MEKVVVIGAGSWGTALAVLLAEKGFPVTMWDLNEEKAKKIQAERENKLFLEGTKFPDNLNVTSDMNDLLKNAGYVVFSVPSQALREVVKKVSGQISENMVLINTAKGIELSTGKRLSEVMKDEVLGKYHENIVILSGPTHAEEVARGVPTAIVAAGKREQSKKVQELFNTERFRVYINEDIVGVEYGAALKNCLALGAGVCDGMGFGDNTKAALLTRGLAEMSRFGEKFGANARTFSGLTGMGDLIVTCTSKHSRNRHVGEELGKGRKLEEILNEMHMVAEGVVTVKAVHELALKSSIQMPIVEAIYRVLYEGRSVKDVVRNLMGRDLKDEFY